MKNDIQKELVRLVTAGSVDDGKSTLIGRLLYDTGSMYKDQVDSLPMTEDNTLDYAAVTDGLLAEREQGITIDVAYRYLDTEKRRFIIADVPGHEQYTRNMVTGASNADVAMLLVDARHGMTTQSKRHLFLTSLLHIPHVLIIVNKMDLVEYSEERFEEIVKEFTAFSSKLQIKDLQFIPISARFGDMIVERQNNMPWYQDRTVYSYLNSVHTRGNKNYIDFRFPVQTVIRPHQDFRGYAGTIEGGVIRPGDDVMVLPSKQTSKVASVLIDGQKAQYAHAAQAPVLTLKDEVDISRGDMLVRSQNVPHVSQTFDATICWMDNESYDPLKRYIIKHTTKSTRAQLEKIVYRIDVNTLHREQTDTLELNDIARVFVSTQEPLFIDAYKQLRHTGSFILIDSETNKTVAAGMISQAHIPGEEKVVSKKKETDEPPVLWFTGLSGSGKTTIATALKKKFDEEGMSIESLDGDVLREGISSDLGFTEEDRTKNMERAGFVAHMLQKHGVWVIATFVSPLQKHRDIIREKTGGNVVEIYVHTPLEVCEARDPKGLYKKARRGEIKDFTGISQPYEAPKSPDILLDTTKYTVEECVEQVWKYIKK